MPRAHHVLNQAPSLATRPNNKEDRPHLKSGDVCVGCIVWLLPRNDHDQSIVCNRTGCCGQEVLEDAGYNHPVVVLGIQQRENSRIYGDIVCSVACVTSFGDMALAAYLKRRQRRQHYQKSIPILKSSVEPLNNIDHDSMKKLILEKGALRKQSYVQLRHTYEIPVSMLCQYAWKSCRAYKMRLSSSSYNILMRELGLLPEIFEKTDTLFETEGRRLSALANSYAPSPSASPLLPASLSPPDSPRVIPHKERHHRLVPSRVNFPTACYGTIAKVDTPRYTPPSSSYTPPYSTSLESSDDNSLSQLCECFVSFIAIGSLVWGRLSR